MNANSASKIGMNGSSTMMLPTIRPTSAKMNRDARSPPRNTSNPPRSRRFIFAACSMYCGIAVSSTSVSSVFQYAGDPPNSTYAALIFASLPRAVASSCGFSCSSSKPRRRCSHSPSTTYTTLPKSYSGPAILSGILLLRLLLLLIFDDAELLQQFVAVDDHVAVQLRNLANLFFLQRVDQLQADVRIARASIQCRALLAHALGDRGLLRDHRLRLLLPPHEIRVRRFLRLFQFALRARQLLGQLRDFLLQIRFVRFERRENLRFEFLRVFLRFLAAIDERLIIGLEREIAEDDLFDDDAERLQVRGEEFRRLARGAEPQIGVVVLLGVEAIESVAHVGARLRPHDALFERARRRRALFPDLRVLARIDAPANRHVGLDVVAVAGLEAEIVFFQAIAPFGFARHHQVLRR